MTNPRHRIILTRLGCALAAYLGLIGGVSLASTDRAAQYADAISQALQPQQISSLIAAATGHGEPGSNPAPAFDQLQRALGVGSEAALALLRILNGLDVPTEQLIDDLAQSTVLYHAVADDLAGIKLRDADGQRMVTEARTAMGAGRFGEVEIQLQQLETYEMAMPEQTSDSPATERPRLTAARVRTLLGKLALMNLQYAEATDDFELARQRIAMASPVATNRTGTAAQPADAQPNRAPTPPLPQLDADWSLHITPQVTTPEPIMTVMVRPAAMLPTQRETSKPDSAPDVTATTGRPQVALRNVPPDMMDLLLRRGDAMLALGDLAAARLLYERAAAAGDARGATGVGKTYDPHVLSLMGARGIQADPVAAAGWYRKALELGDSSAAARLKLLADAGGHGG